MVLDQTCGETTYVTSVVVAVSVGQRAPPEPACPVHLGRQPGRVSDGTRASRRARVSAVKTLRAGPVTPRKRPGRGKVCGEAVRGNGRGDDDWTAGQDTAGRFSYTLEIHARIPHSYTHMSVSLARLS